MTPDELTGVTTSVEHGAARGVIAHHIGVTSIRIAPGIRLDGTAERQFTRQVVEVYPANGAINIAPVTGLRQVNGVTRATRR